MHIIPRRGQLGVAAVVAVAVAIATASTATAGPPVGSSSVEADTLTVIGTDGADQIALRLAPGEPNRLQVDFDDDGSVDQSVDRTTFTQIEVVLRNGDDRLRVDQTNGAFADDPVTVDAGRGDDSIATGDGNDVVDGGNGDDTFDGNRGVDTAVLGAGDDTFVWDAGDGSDDVDGGAGIDDLVFNGSGQNEVMTLSADGRTSLFLRDPGGIRMDLRDVEGLDLAALGGADTITIGDLSRSTFREADIDLALGGEGDDQTDVVTVTGSPAADTIVVRAVGLQVDVDGLTAATHVTGTETIDRLQVSSLDGNDAVEVDPDARALIGVAVDLGSGQP